MIQWLRQGYGSDPWLGKLSSHMPWELPSQFPFTPVEAKTQHKMGIFSHQKKKKMFYFSLPKVNKKMEQGPVRQGSKNNLAAESTETLLNVPNQLKDNSKCYKDNFTEDKN